MKVTVEFTGIAREIAGVNQRSFHLVEGSTYNQLVEKLSALFPALIGPVIVPETKKLVNATVFARSQDVVIFPGDMDAPVKDGEKLTLIFFIVGG
jgi:molybdopterin converting factor small subunit